MWSLIVLLPQNLRVGKKQLKIGVSAYFSNTNVPWNEALHKIPHNHVQCE